MRALTTEEKAVIKKAKDAVNRLRTAKRQEIAQQLKTLPRNTPKSIINELEARRDNLAPIIGTPAQMTTRGSDDYVTANYDAVKKVLTSVRKRMTHRAYMDNGRLILEYGGGGVEGRVEFYACPDYAELDGLVPIIELAG